MNWIILLLAGLFEVSLTFCLGKARAASGVGFYLWGSGFLASTILSMTLLATEERLISMLSAIASERYKELLEKEPDLLQRLPLGSIATYLGVTQTSLSRIRAKITRP